MQVGIWHKSAGREDLGAKETDLALALPADPALFDADGVGLLHFGFRRRNARARALDGGSPNCRYRFREHLDELYRAVEVTWTLPTISDDICVLRAPECRGDCFAEHLAIKGKQARKRDQFVVTLRPQPLPGNPRPRSSAQVTRFGPIIPMTARPLKGSSAGRQGARVNVSCRRMTASLPVGVVMERS